MTEDDFIENHTEYSFKDSKNLIVNLAIMNVKVGTEAIELAKAYGMAPSTLMMEFDSNLSGIKHTQDYITFVNNRGESFITTSDIALRGTSYRQVYYPEVKEFIKELIKSNGDEDYQQSIDEMYKLFGMTKN